MAYARHVGEAKDDDDEDDDGNEVVEEAEGLRLFLAQRHGLQACPPDSARPLRSEVYASGGTDEEHRHLRHGGRGGGGVRSARRRGGGERRGGGGGGRRRRRRAGRSSGGGRGPAAAPELAQCYRLHWRQTHAGSGRFQARICEGGKSPRQLRDGGRGGGGVRAPRRRGGGGGRMRRTSRWTTTDVEPDDEDEVVEEAEGLRLHTSVEQCHEHRLQGRHPGLCWLQGWQAHRSACTTRRSRRQGRVTLGRSLRWRHGGGCGGGVRAPRRSTPRRPGKRFDQVVRTSEGCSATSTRRSRRLHARCAESGGMEVDAATSRWTTTA